MTSTRNISKLEAVDNLQRITRITQHNSNPNVIFLISISFELNVSMAQFKALSLQYLVPLTVAWIASPLSVN